jgi:hypothetical protein
VTDPGIIKSRNVAVSQKLANYVRNGGTLVLGGLFSAQIRPNDLGRYMREKWDIPWEAGSYYRTTIFLNRAVVNRPTSGLLSSYSHKAVFLKHVDPNMAWYVATDRSVIESLVPLPGPGIELLETTAVVLEMLGLTSSYLTSTEAQSYCYCTSDHSIAIESR